MNRKHLLICFILLPSQVFAQKDPAAIKYAEAITIEDLKDNLSIIPKLRESSPILSGLVSASMTTSK